MNVILVGKTTNFYTKTNNSNLLLKNRIFHLKYDNYHIDSN